MRPRCCAWPHNLRPSVPGRIGVRRFAPKNSHSYYQQGTTQQLKSLCGILCISVVLPGEKFLTQSDPTDNALAAIASILDHSSEKPDDKAEGESETPSDSQPPTPVAEEAEEEAAPALVE